MKATILGNASNLPQIWLWQGRKGINRKLYPRSCKNDLPTGLGLHQHLWPDQGNYGNKARWDFLGPMKVKGSRGGVCISCRSVFKCPLSRAKEGGCLPEHLEERRVTWTDTSHTDTQQARRQLNYEVTTWQGAIWRGLASLFTTIATSFFMQGQTQQLPTLS